MFFDIACFYFFVLVVGPAVIGYSCCGVPANVLSVCFVLFFFFGEANIIKNEIKYLRLLISILYLYIFSSFVTAIGTYTAI